MGLPAHRRSRPANSLDKDDWGVLYFAQYPFPYLFIRPMSDHCLVLSVAQSVLLLNFAQIVGFVKVDRLIVTWICQNQYMYFSMFISIGICQN